MQVSLKVLDADWEGAETEDVLAVARSVTGCFSGAVAERRIEPILVEPTPPNRKFPEVLYQRSTTGEVRIRLSSRGTYWAQMAFQFAHEFCHVLANFRLPFSHGSMWIEESLCETSSLFAIRRMAEIWRDIPPYPHWREYVASLDSYFEKLCAEPIHQLPAGVTFSEWLRSKLIILRSDHTRRADNTIIAKQLLPIFEADPDAWRAVRYLNCWDATLTVDVDAYCAQWRGVTAQHLHPAIDSIELCLTGIPGQ